MVRMRSSLQSWNAGVDVPDACALLLQHMQGKIATWQLR